MSSASHGIYSSKKSGGPIYPPGVPLAAVDTSGPSFWFIETQVNLVSSWTEPYPGRGWNSQQILTAGTNFVLRNSGPWSDNLAPSIFYLYFSIQATSSSGSGRTVGVTLSKGAQFFASNYTATAVETDYLVTAAGFPINTSPLRARCNGAGASNVITIRFKWLGYQL